MTTAIHPRPLAIKPRLFTTLILISTFILILLLHYLLLILLLIITLTIIITPMDLIPNLSISQYRPLGIAAIHPIVPCPVWLLTFNPAIISLHRL